jgi:hypothetical protein
MVILQLMWDFLRKLTLKLKKDKYSKSISISSMSLNSFFHVFKFLLNSCTNRFHSKHMYVSLHFQLWSIYFLSPLFQAAFMFHCTLFTMPFNLLIFSPLVDHLLHSCVIKFNFLAILLFRNAFWSYLNQSRILFGGDSLILQWVEGGVLYL